MSVQDGDILKAVLEFVLADGTIIQNIVHWVAEFITPQSEVDVLSAAKQYGEDLYDEIDTWVDLNVVVNPMTLHELEWDAVEGLWVVDRLIGITTPSITFTGATDPLPHQCSAVLVGNTARPKSRGRKFLPPFLDLAADGSDWVSAVLTGLGLALNHYLADEVVTASNDLSPGVPRTAANEFLPFGTGIVNSIVGTQRRRKPGIGM